MTAHHAGDMPVRYGDVMKAKELYELKLTWPAVAVVMREYHDVDRVAATWRKYVQLQFPDLQRRPRGGSTANLAQFRERSIA